MIHPTFRGGPHEVKVISEDEFIFKFFPEIQLNDIVCEIMWLLLEIL